MTERIAYFHESIDGHSLDIIPLYMEMVASAKGGEVFVELGAWKGKSAAFMAVEIVNSGKGIHFDVVDLWERAEFLRTLEGHPYEPATNAEFVANTAPARTGIRRIIQSDTSAAAARYDDESVDFVYVDACHRYAGCKADLDAWWPKVRAGGILSGHDYAGEYQGVVDAVDEFAKREGLPVEHRGITWIVRKGTNV